MNGSMICAQRGARLLDQYYRNPYWDEKIDLRKLDIHNPRWCVVGQLNGGWFGKGMAKLGISIDAYNDVYDHGFSGHTEMTNAWKELITSRIQQRKGGNGPAVHYDDKPVRRWKVFPFPHYEHNRRAASRELVDAVHGG